MPKLREISSRVVTDSVSGHHIFDNLPAVSIGPVPIPTCRLEAIGAKRGAASQPTTLRLIEARSPSERRHNVVADWSEFLPVPGPPCLCVGFANTTDSCISSPGSKELYDIGEMILEVLPGSG